MRDLTDEELVAAYLDRGDDRAFRVLMERHQERIFGYLIGMVRDRDVANDLFQDTMIRAIQAMHKRRAAYERQGRWLAWTMRIARNAALDWLRSRKKFQDVSGRDDEGTPFFERLADDAPDVTEVLQSAEAVERLREAIEELPPEQKEVVLLRTDSELTFREIAEITDVSINTALGRMRYALINLRKIMLPQPPKEAAQKAAR